MQYTKAQPKNVTKKSNVLNAQNIIQRVIGGMAMERQEKNSPIIKIIGLFSAVFAKIRKLRSSVHADSSSLNKQKKYPITCSPTLDPTTCPTTNHER